MSKRVLISIFCILTLSVQAIPSHNIKPPPHIPCDSNTEEYVISIRKTSNLAPFCSGSLLNPRWVLTASHCVHDIDHPSKIVVGGGNPRDTKVAVHSMHMHPLYDPKTIENDVALLLLLRKLHRNNLADLPLPGGPHQGAVATVVGWTRNRHDKVKENKHSNFCINVLMLDVDFCANVFYGLVKDGMLCVSFGGKGEQPCPGDSGGPLVSDGKVVGIVSFGARCDAHFLPSVMTNVSNYLDFIEMTRDRFKDVPEGSDGRRLTVNSLTLMPFLFICLLLY